MHLKDNKVLLISIALIVLLCIGTVIIISSWGKVLTFPYAIDYGEGPVLNQSKIISTGLNPYIFDWSNYPYLITNYTPVYYFIYGILGNIFGFSIILGRAISIIAAIIASIVVGLIIWTQTKNRFSSFVGATLMMVSPFFLYGSSLARVDIMALTLSLVGLLVAFRWRQKSWSILVSSLFIIASISTKQSFLIASPLAIFGWYFVDNWKRALSFLVLLASGILLSFSLFYWLSDGQFYFHTILGNNNFYSLEQAVTLFRYFIYSSPVLIGIVVAELILLSKTDRNIYIFASLYLLGSIGSALMVGKIGAGETYFLEILAAVCIITGFSISRWLNIEKVPSLRMIFIFLICFQVIWSLNVSQFYINSISRRIDYRVDLDELSDIIKIEHNPILADEHMELLPLNNRELLLQPFEFTQLALEGKWDQSKVIQDIENQVFGLIIISDQPPLYSEELARTRWTPQMLAALKDYYHSTKVLAGTSLYRPKLK